MIGSTQQILYPEKYLCECADKFVACTAKVYLNWFKYKIGKEPDIDLVLKVARMRRIVCEEECGLCPEELGKMREMLNKIVN